jgi:transcriptional regulator with PAS, ATPase and Fis domain
MTNVRRANLDALVGIVDTGMFTVDPQLKIRSMNEEAIRLLGCERCEEKQQCSECLGPEIAAEEGPLRATFSDHRPRRDLSVRIQPKEGPARDMLVSTAFLDASDAGSREVVGTLRDAGQGERIRRALRDRWVFHELVMVSLRMKEIVNLVREMAPYDSTVLVLGESGTGKELVARAVHAESGRSDRSFVTVNCSAYSEGVLESELFGHVHGAFTGATRDRTGRFEAANGGTVFLDEIGEISPAIQVKLLRVLQERVIERVGEQRRIPVDIRIIAATNRDLKAAVRDGTFREDLYYRLNVIALHLPPLRDRREDIPALTDHFLEVYGDRIGKTVDAVSDEALECLFQHDWPGNVRELQNAIEHAVVRARGPVILPRDLPRDTCGSKAPENGGDMDERIDAALKAAGGQLGRAAELLGIHRTTLWRRLKKRTP